MSSPGAYQRLKSWGYVADNVVGKLKLESRADSAYYRGIYDFDAGDKHVHAGVPRLLDSLGIPIPRSAPRREPAPAELFDNAGTVDLLAGSSPMTRARYQGLVRKDGRIEPRKIYYHSDD